MPTGYLQQRERSQLAKASLSWEAKAPCSWGRRASTRRLEAGGWRGASSCHGDIPKPQLN